MLPIHEALPRLKAALSQGSAAVLVAPPGAGKTTVVPLELLAEPWMAGGKIIVLEPRRLAARAAAERMAQTLGEIASLTGPVSGLFQGAVQGGEAFANYVNSTSGGICGRHVNVDVADDGTNCTQDENATQTLSGKAFALSGTFALYDGCGASIVKANPSIADIHVALDPSAYTPPNHFDISAGGSGFATGMFRYYRQKLGSKLDHVGSIVENIPSAIAQQAMLLASGPGIAT